MDDDAFDASQSGRPRRHDGRDPWSLVPRAEVAASPEARAATTADPARDPGLPAIGDAIAVLLRRDRRDDQGRFEEVWLDVTSVDGAALGAVFDSQPTWVRGVSSGDALTLSAEHVLVVRRPRLR